MIPGADHRIEAIGAGGAARQALRILAVGLLVGVLLGATPLRQWTESLPDVPGATALHDAAVAWERAMDRLRLTRPYAGVREALRGLEDTPGWWPSARD